MVNHVLSLHRFTLRQPGRKRVPLFLIALIALIMIAAIGAFGGMMVWLTALASPPAPAQRAADNVGALCAFRAVTVTVTASARLSDTAPAAPISRTVYFASNVVSNTAVVIPLTLTVSLTGFPPLGSCYLWAVPAPGQTANLPIPMSANTPTVVLTRSLPGASGTPTSTRFSLTSSYRLTGSLTISASHRLVLTFTPDITSPASEVTSSVRAVPIGRPIPLRWWAMDAGCGVRAVTLHYVTDDGLVGSVHLPTQSGEMDFVPPDVSPTKTVVYGFGTQAVDHLLNREVLTADLWVAVYPHRLYLPAMMRNYPPQPAPGSVTLAGGRTCVYQDGVTLTVTSTVPGGVDTVAWMRFANEAPIWDEDGWVPFAPTANWTLAPGLSGRRTVYAQFRGRMGGVSSPPVSDTVLLVWNGDFETGALTPGWEGEAAPLPLSIVSQVQERTGGSTPPADGQYALLLGATDYPCTPNGVPLGYAAVAQTLRLPPDEPLRLTFRYIIWSQDASIGDPYDRFEVWVNDELRFFDGNQVNEGLGCDQWWRVPGPENPRNGQSDGWATGTVDLSAYAGEDVTIIFLNANRYDGWYNTYTYLDVVTLTPVSTEK